MEHFNIQPWGRGGGPSGGSHCVTSLFIIGKIKVLYITLLIYLSTGKEKRV